MISENRCQASTTAGLSGSNTASASNTGCPNTRIFRSARVLAGFVDPRGVADSLRFSKEATCKVAALAAALKVRDQNIGDCVGALVPLRSEPCQGTIQL